MFVLVSGKAQNSDSTSHHRLRKNAILPLPLVIKSIETGWSFGAVTAATYYINKKDTFSRTSNSELIALYSLKRQFVTALNGTQYFNHEKLILSEQISFSSFPDKFWGIGPNAKNEAEESYSFKQIYVNLHPWIKLGRSLFIGFPFEMQKLISVDYKPGGLLETQNIAGRDGYFIAGLGTSITYDTRNHAFTPNGGTYLQLFFNHFDDYLGSHYTYSNLVVDFRKYMPLSRKTVLATQLNYFGVFGNQIPLRSLALLGGSNSMRGYHSGRFRDNQLLVAQAEWRHNFNKSLGIVFFGGLANVADSPGKFELRSIKHSFGGGFRFSLNKKERLNLRLDYGIGRDGNSGFYFQIGEAF
ncbi:MAG: BamA/TamA family outer membrane protein [Chitinophagaceae bacterium]